MHHTYDWTRYRDIVNTLYRVHHTYDRVRYRDIVIVPSHLLDRPSVRYPAEIRDDLAGNEMKRTQIGTERARSRAAADSTKRRTLANDTLKITIHFFKLLLI